MWAELSIELLALCLYGPAIVVLHEGGHAAFARWGGYRVTSFGVGLGRPLWSLYLRGGVVLHADRWLLAGGACTAVPLGPPGPRRAWFHAGGLLVQLLLAVLLLVLPSSWLGQRIAAFNVLVALTNAIPWRTRSQASDGWHLLDAFAGGRRMGHPLGQRGPLRRMRAREALVESPMGLAWCDVVLAWSDVQLGQVDEAEERLADAAAQVTREPWMEALHAMVSCEWCRARGDTDTALDVVRHAQALEGLDAYGRALLDHAEARVWVARGEVERARGTLARVVGHAGLLGNQAGVTLLLAELASNAPDADAVEHATWRVEWRILGGFLDPVDAMVALHGAAEVLNGRGRRRAAAGARSSAHTLRERTVVAVGVRETAWVDARTRAVNPDVESPDDALGSPGWW